MYLIYMKMSFNDSNCEKALKYMNAIPESLYKRTRNNFVFLYAWTDKKKNLKEFKKTRNMKYFIIENDDEWDEEFLQTYFNELELKLEIYTDGLREIRYRTDPKYPDKDRTSLPEGPAIMTTDFELECIEYDPLDIRTSIIQDYGGHDYTLLKDKYINALSDIGYCHIYDMWYSIDDGRVAYADWNESYSQMGNVATSHPARASIMPQIDSAFTLYMIYFGFTIYIDGGDEDE